MGTTPTTRERLARPVMAAIGVLLLTAAGLKLYGMSVSAVPPVGWFAHPSVQIAVIEWEIVLGVWLVAGVARLGARLAAVLTFCGFAVVSGYLGWVGVANCGCFGAIEASPWHAFAVDVASLLLLSTVGPSWRQVRNTSRAELLRMPTGFAGAILGAGLILGAATGVSTWVYGSPAAALARLQGVPVYTPGYVDFGSGEPGEKLVRAIAITNWTGEPVRLIGGTSDCSCITTANMPLTIAPGETHTVQVGLKVPGALAGNLTRRVELWTDCDLRRILPVVVACRVR